MRRWVLVAVFAALACLALPSIAAAQTCPSFDGLMSFQAIQGPGGPEEFCWEVNLGEEQELRQVNDQEAGVFYTDPEEHRASSIKAGLAHDADGTEVPTTIAVVQPNVIVLTVHQRAGNPAAGGTPFDYPISAGAGWEGGFQTVEVKMPPPTEQAPTSTGDAPAPTCEIPVLQGRTLNAARRALSWAGCQLGQVRGHRSRGARIVKQYRPAYKVLPASTEVGVRLAR